MSNKFRSKLSKICW